MNSKWLFLKNDHKAIEKNCKKIKDTKKKKENKFEYLKNENKIWRSYKKPLKY
jgi:hypothetical protein